MIGETSPASWPQAASCGSPDRSPMAWQTVISIEGRVRGFSQKGRRTQPSSLDRGCISLNSAWGQGAHWEGKGWLACPKIKEAES